MAYINAQEVKAIRDQLKKELPQYKFGVRKGSGGHSVGVTFIKGPAFEKFETYDRYQGEFKEVDLNEGYHQVNPYWIKESAGEENATVMEKVIEIIKTAPAKVLGGKEWYNNSDIMTDYFDVAYYFDINIGKDYQNGYVVA
jgi:hypothetical protein